jgi:hypothetical protein
MSAVLIAAKLLAGNALSAVWRFLKGASAWQLLALGLAVFALVQHFQLAGERRHSAKLQAQITKIASDARETKAKLDAANARIAADIREKNDEENRRIAGTADDLRVSGPGRSRAACPPAASGGHHPPNGKPDAAGPQMPSDDLAAVPWQWLVQRSEQADLNRAEVIAWRNWYDRLLKQWPKN